MRPCLKRLQTRRFCIELSSNFLPTKHSFFFRSFGCIIEAVECVFFSEQIIVYLLLHMEGKLENLIKYCYNFREKINETIWVIEQILSVTADVSLVSRN